MHIYSERRVQWPVHGNSQRAVNRPFNTATHHSATLRSLRPDTPCAFEGHTARQASTHRCRTTCDLTALRMSGRPTRSSSAVHPVTAALRALREPRRIDRGRQRRHHAGVRASPPRHGSSRWLAALRRPRFPNRHGSLALRGRHRSPAPLPRFSVRPFQAPHMSRLRNQCAQCGALIALTAANTTRKRLRLPF